MKPYECKKVENCFGGTHVYEYRLNMKISEDFINRFSKIGLLKLHRNFPRPFFQIALADGTTTKGVLADSVLKVSFPVGDPQGSKEKFETVLEELLNQQIAGGER